MLFSELVDVSVGSSVSRRFELVLAKSQCRYWCRDRCLLLSQMAVCVKCLFVISWGIYDVSDEVISRGIYELVFINRCLLPLFIVVVSVRVDFCMSMVVSVFVSEFSVMVVSVSVSVSISVGDGDGLLLLLLLLLSVLLLLLGLVTTRIRDRLDSGIET